jgi:hypothetical protein
LLAQLARCGRAVLQGLPEAQRELFGRAAGCGGRRLRLVADADEAGSALQTLVEAADPSPPTAAELAAFQGGDLRAWRQVMLALLVWLAAGLALLLARPRRGLLPLLALTAALLAVGSLRWRSPEPRLFVWAEADAGERTARYAARTEPGGSGGGAVPVRPPEPQAVTRLCDPQRPAEWTWDAEAAQPTRVASRGSLFDPQALCHHGHFALLRAAQVQRHADGSLELRNEGATGWPEGRLFQNGRLHPLPAIAAGTSIVLRAGPGTAPRDALERGAATRSPFGGLGLLWPLELRGASALPREAQGWLLLRLPAAADEAGA